MNAYLFSAGVTKSQVRPNPGRYRPSGESLQMWDSCLSAIVYGGELAQAQTAFEAWCRRCPENEKPIETEIKKIVAAPFIEQMLTETGSRPLDWDGISKHLWDIALATPMDDFEQGYWVDVNPAVPPRKLSYDIESLERELPGDIRSGLNWSPDKQCFFLLS